MWYDEKDDMINTDWSGADRHGPDLIVGAILLRDELIENIKVD